MLFTINACFKKVISPSNFFMKKLYIVFFVALLISGTQVIFPKNTEAACRCVCVNGQKQNLCTSTLDIPQACFGLCPLTSPSIKPLEPLKLKPLGTTSCTMKQVWNSWTNSYQWQRVCR